MHQKEDFKEEIKATREPKSTLKKLVAFFTKSTNDVLGTSRAIKRYEVTERCLERISVGALYTRFLHLDFWPTVTVSSPFDHLTVTPQEVFYAAMKGYELGENALRSMLLSSVGQLALRNDFFQLSRKEQDQLFGMIEAYVSEYRNQINPQTSATILPFRRK